MILRLLTCMLLIRSGVAPGADLAADKQGDSVRKSAFSVGMTGMRHSLKAGDGNEVIGNSAAVQIGSGYISDAWFANASLDIILGPYEPSRDRQLDVDYVGTGLTIFSGFSAQTRNLRSAEGGYGFALGISYADIVGRSSGKNRLDTGRDTPEDRELIDNYVIRVTNLALVPAIFFSWLKPARPRGNDPELLMTRLEGQILTLGVAMPLISSYQSKYDTRSRPDPVDPAQEIPATTVHEKGRLRGYSIVLGLTAMLGT